MGVHNNLLNLLLRVSLFEQECNNSFLISSFRRVQNVVCFLLGDSPASKSDAGESSKRKQIIILCLKYYISI